MFDFNFKTTENFIPYAIFIRIYKFYNEMLNKYLTFHVSCTGY